MRCNSKTSIQYGSLTHFYLISFIQFKFMKMNLGKFQGAAEVVLRYMGSQRVRNDLETEQQLNYQSSVFWDFLLGQCALNLVETPETQCFLALCFPVALVFNICTSLVSVVLIRIIKWPMHLAHIDVLNHALVKDMAIVVNWKIQIQFSQTFIT